MQRVARLTGTSLMELQEKVAWHFYDKYDHALTGLSVSSMWIVFNCSDSGAEFGAGNVG